MIGIASITSIRPYLIRLADRSGAFSIGSLSVSSRLIIVPLNVEGIAYGRN